MRPRSSCLDVMVLASVVLGAPLGIAGCPHAPEPPSKATHASASAAANEKRAPIVVALVVDQMAAWIAEERWPLLPKTGGFARLAREGTLVRELRYAHAVTDTAPGHAALFTGQPPHATGIVGNEVVKDGKYTSFLRDLQTRVVSSEGAHDGSASSSIARLRVETVADRLRATIPNATIVSVSIKDRGAIFGGGRAPNATLWFDVSLDRFVTSSAFPPIAKWAVPLATHTAIEQRRAQPWELLDRAFVQQHAKSIDDQSGEGSWEGLGTTFPHDVAGSSQPAISWRATPFADEAVLALGTAAIRARDPAAPMLLTLSLSAHDYVNHVFGPDSWESWDELMRVDRGLAILFQALDEAVGAEGWSALLSGDHGGPPIPELSLADRPWCTAKDRWGRACDAPKRLYVEPMAKDLEAAAQKALGAGRWIDGVADPYVFYADAARALPPAKLDALDLAMRTALLATPGVQEVFFARKMPEACPPESDESTAALVCRSIAKDAPGDVYVVTRAGTFFDPRYAVGKGQNHGSPWLFDRTVPLLARAPGRIAPGRVLEGPLSFATYARTLSSLLGVTLDPIVAGKDLAAP